MAKTGIENIDIAIYFHSAYHDVIVFDVCSIVTLSKLSKKLMERIKNFSHFEMSKKFLYPVDDKEPL